MFIYTLNLRETGSLFTKNITFYFSISQFKHQILKPPFKKQHHSRIKIICWMTKI